jgi:hypothetical protein
MITTYPPIKEKVVNKDIGKKKQAISKIKTM